jgi:hypothetical protein
MFDTGNLGQVFILIAADPTGAEVMSTVYPGLLVPIPILLVVVKYMAGTTTPSEVTSIIRSRGLATSVVVDFMRLYAVGCPVGAEKKNPPDESITTSF